MVTESPGRVAIHGRGLDSARARRAGGRDRERRRRALCLESSKRRTIMAVPISCTSALIMCAEAMAARRASYSFGDGTASRVSRGCHWGSSVKVGMFPALSSDSIVWIEAVSSDSKDNRGVGGLLSAMLGQRVSGDGSQNLCTECGGLITNRGLYVLQQGCERIHYLWAR